MLLNKPDNVAHRLNVLDLLVGDLGVKLVLQGHHQVHHVQGIGPQVVNDGSLPFQIPSYGSLLIGLL